MQKYKQRRRASLTNSTGPRGGKTTTHTRNVTGPRGGLYRETTVRRAGSGRKISHKRVYVGAS